MTCWLLEHGRASLLEFEGGRSHVECQSRATARWFESRCYHVGRAV